MQRTMTSGHNTIMTIDGGHDDSHYGLVLVTV